jgi:hypothetical protein
MLGYGNTIDCGYLKVAYPFFVLAGDFVEEDIQSA